MALAKFVRCPGPCPRESYGVCPRAQANIACLGTPGQRIFYYKPQAQAHVGMKVHGKPKKSKKLFTIRCSLYPFFLQWIFSGKSMALRVACFSKKYGI
jgi:hypothetical protein